MTTPPPARVLVTGSRHYTDRGRVWAVLDAAYARLGPLVVVHGDASGADRLAKAWAVRRAGQLGWAVTHEPHPADWPGPCREECRGAGGHGPRKQRRGGGTYCPAAGEYRNREMGDLGAAGYAAFPLPGSAGTWRMVAYARSKAIPPLPEAA